MDNLDIYNKSRAVPKEALKQIVGGRLKGMSDINPMWRIKKLTELFGMCGVGWKYVITKQWTEQGSNDQISAFVNIDLFVKIDGVWSDAIPGTGGSAYIAKESSGYHTSDECFKMALTDAISVACKALGFGADVYWGNDATKYNTPKAPAPVESNNITDAQLKKIFATVKELLLPPEEAKKLIGEMYNVTSTKDLTKANAKDFIEYLEKYKKGLQEAV